MSTSPKISFACPIPWTEMKGGDVSRYCSSCGHTIHNVSALSQVERAALLQRARAEKICGSYFMRLSGELVTPEAPLSAREARSVRQVGVALLSAGALALAAGCVSQPVEPIDSSKPKEELGSLSKPEDEEVVQLVGFIINVDEPKSSDAK